MQLIPATLITETPSDLANTKTYRFNENEIAHMNHYVANEEPQKSIKFTCTLLLAKLMRTRTTLTRLSCISETQSNTASYSTKCRRDQTRRTSNQSALQSCLKNEMADPELIYIHSRIAQAAIVEQILASHSQIDGTLELQTFLV